APMAHAAVGPQVHEALDVHGHFAAQVAFDGELRDLRTDGVDFGLGEVFHLRRRLDASSGAGGERTGASHAEDVREPDPHVLVHRDIDAGYACHVSLPETARK